MTHKVIYILFLFILLIPLGLSQITVTDGVVLTPTNDSTVYITNRNTSISTLVVTDVLIDYDSHLITIKSSNATTVRIIDPENYIITVAGGPAPATINVTNEPFLYTLYRNIFTFHFSSGYWEVFIWNTDDVLSLVNKLFHTLVCPDTTQSVAIFLGVLFFYLLITAVSMLAKLDIMGAIGSLGYIIYALFVVTCFAGFGWIMVGIGIGFLLYFIFHR